MLVRALAGLLNPSLCSRVFRCRFEAGRQVIRVEWETYVASVKADGNAALLLHFLRHHGGIRLSMVVGGRWRYRSTSNFRKTSSAGEFGAWQKSARLEALGSNELVVLITCTIARFSK